MISKYSQISVFAKKTNLHSFVLGTLLGDGYITKNGNLQIEHKDFEYTHWKFVFLKNENTLPISTKISKVERIHSKTKKKSFSYRFYTKPVFKEWRNVFYKENKKKNLPNFLDSIFVDSLSLAIWFMDDGGKGGNTVFGRIFSVTSFTDHEIFFLQEILKKNFNLETTFHAAKTSIQLYIPTNQYSTFKNIVLPFIIPSQRYKL